MRQLWRVMMSQWRQKLAILNFETAILNPEPAVLQLTMTTSKNICNCSKEHT